MAKQEIIEIRFKIGTGSKTKLWQTKKVRADSINRYNLCSNPFCNNVVSSKGRKKKNKTGNHYCSSKCRGEHSNW